MGDQGSSVLLLDPFNSTICFISTSACVLPKVMNDFDHFMLSQMIYHSAKIKPS